MQVGYKVVECNDKDCIYRTEPVTIADRIRAMSDEELAKEIALIAVWGRLELAKAKRGQGLVQFMLDWLLEPAKED